MRFDSQFCSILGHGLQIDHKDSLGFAFSQIIDYLLSEKLISFRELNEILIKTASYVNIKRIGRLIGNLISFEIIQFDEVIEILRFYKKTMDLDDISLANLILGMREKYLSMKQEEELLIYFLRAVSEASNSIMKGKCSENLIKVLSVIMASDLQERKPLLNIIKPCLYLKNQHVVAKVLKCLFDSMLLLKKELIMLFSQLIDTKILTWEQLPPLLSSSFAIKEIATVVLDLLRNHEKSLSAQYFIDFFKAFYNSKHLRFTNTEIQHILEYIDSQESDLVYRITGRNMEELMLIFSS
ncbi:MAG: hypothetical protein ACTSYC_09150 [Promethearchaeota archaeon]